MCVSDYFAKDRKFYRLGEIWCRGVILHTCRAQKLYPDKIVCYVHLKITLCRSRSMSDTQSTQPLRAGLLRESVLPRYAQYCNQVRERLLIDQ